jgi:hypothetical protein
MIIYRLMILMLILWLLPVSGYAKVYRYVDEKGVERYSNKPPPEGATLIETEKEIEYDEAADREQQERNRKAAEAFDARPAPPAAASPSTPTEINVNVSGSSDGDGTYYRRHPRRTKPVPRKKPAQPKPVIKHK